MRYKKTYLVALGAFSRHLHYQKQVQKLSISDGIKDANPNANWTQVRLIPSVRIAGRALSDNYAVRRLICS